MNKVTPFLYGLKMGVLYAVATIMLTLVYYVTGLDGQMTMSSIINMVVSVLLLVYITKSFRKARGGYMSLGQGVCMITVTGVVATVISYFFNLVYINYIDTHYVEKSLMRAQEMMASMGGMNDEVIDAMRTQLEAQMSFSVTTLGIALLGALVMYAIAGLILGAIFRKNDPDAID